jgi:hypothetical protein
MTVIDDAGLLEHGHIHAEAAAHQPVRWRAEWKLEKFHGDDTDADPYEVIEGIGNLLMYGGASCLWECLIGDGTSSGGASLTYFDNAHAYIGVGDSTTAEAATQTDLQASSNKLRKAVDATFPSHSDGTTSGAATITFKATFATTDANFHWQEWGIFNGSSGGRMLNRKVTDLGTKTSASAWAFTVTLTLA